MHVTKQLLYFPFSSTKVTISKDNTEVLAQPLSKSKSEGGERRAEMIVTKDKSSRRRRGQETKGRNLEDRKRKG